MPLSVAVLTVIAQMYLIMLGFVNVSWDIVRLSNPTPRPIITWECQAQGHNGL
jgi:hypothetical protein